MGLAVLKLNDLQLDPSLKVAVAVSRLHDLQLTDGLEVGVTVSKVPGSTDRLFARDGCDSFEGSRTYR